MVGVPALLRWEAGPSGRICWPICKAVRRVINHGPRKNDTLSAMIAAINVRNVM